jgi:hypothetical protein
MTSVGRVQFATFVGGTRRLRVQKYNDEAAGVWANCNGDVYLTGCTLETIGWRCQLGSFSRRKQSGNLNRSCFEWNLRFLSQLVRHARS